MPTESKTKKATTKNVKQTCKKIDFDKKILFATSEAVPFIKTGGLADVAGALPKALVDRGVDCRVILPLYMDINQELRDKMQYLGNVYVSLSWRYQYCGLFKAVCDGVTYYFVDNEYYFKRSGLYGYFDDGERFAFFAKAVLESIKLMDGFYPDIIHSNDWQTALVPVFLDVFYREDEHYKNIKTVYTIHNIEFQGRYSGFMSGDVLGLPDWAREFVDYSGDVNYMKGGIERANKVTTVSQTYAQEILNAYFGYGMNNILVNRQYKLSGIINGIDVKSNDPKTDKHAYVNYDLSTFGKKVENKLKFQDALGLPVDANIPMIGMVGRLTHQKGLDLIAPIITRILDMGVQLVILGTGDYKYEEMLRNIQSRYPNNLRSLITFSSELASKIYCASDMFLMPSKFEPCGLSQMIAMRYGTLPIVRETGGLKDTVIPYDYTTGQGTGFTFYSYNAYDLLNAVERAVGMYRDYKEDWSKIVRNAMTQDFSWENISLRYLDLYKQL
ncbi:MAG: glycogen synthase GlgA [Clostridia bacterium]|nr:glycogen synthase GlgA [Clostridia bacterium]MDE6759031.1 glycogen synthase GlgA [Clostridia bacterium]